MQDAEACQRISFTAAILEPTRGAALEVWPIREHETKERGRGYWQAEARAAKSALV